MHVLRVFSLAQCVGYLAFILGVSAFLQKKDKGLKLLMTGQCLVYAVHFFLLGNLPAAGSTAISCIRTGLSLKTRSPYLAAAVIVANIVVGAALAKGGSGWLPVIAVCLGTFALFILSGIPMRLVFLLCTVFWLTNNILSGSIGGTMLEATIGVVNTVTIVRLLRTSADKTSSPKVEAEAASCES